MPLLCNCFGFEALCRVALQGKHYFTESDFVEGMDEAAPDLSPSLLLKAIHSKNVERMQFESILVSLSSYRLGLVLLLTPFGIQEHILEASAKKLVVVHLLKPLILHIFLGVITSANSQPIKALAKEEFSCTLRVEKLSHVVLPCE